MLGKAFNTCIQGDLLILTIELFLFCGKIFFYIGWQNKVTILGAAV